MGNVLDIIRRAQYGITFPELQRISGLSMQEAIDEVIRLQDEDKITRTTRGDRFYIKKFKIPRIK